MAWASINYYYPGSLDLIFIYICDKRYVPMTCSNCVTPKQPDEYSLSVRQSVCSSVCLFVQNWQVRMRNVTHTVITGFINKVSQQTLNNQLLLPGTVVHFQDQQINYCTDSSDLAKSNDTGYVELWYIYQNETKPKMLTCEIIELRIPS